MADILHMRYCWEQSLEYTEIGEDLKISPEHARRLASRAIKMLDDQSIRADVEQVVEKGTRLWKAIARG